VKKQIIKFYLFKFTLKYYINDGSKLMSPTKFVVSQREVWELEQATRILTYSYLKLVSPQTIGQINVVNPKRKVVFKRIADLFQKQL